MRLTLLQYEAVRLCVSHPLPLYEVVTPKILPFPIHSFALVVLLSIAEMDIGGARSFWRCEPLKCFPFVETSCFMVDINLSGFIEVSLTIVVLLDKVPYHLLSDVVCDNHCHVYSFIECLVLLIFLFQGRRWMDSPSRLLGRIRWPLIS